VADIIAQIDDIGVQAMMGIWAKKPEEFCRDVLRMQPQPWQSEFMQAVSDARHGLNNDGVEYTDTGERIKDSGKLKMKFTIRSGTGVGKTSGVSALILWHLAVFPDSKIPCTAPTSPQIKAVLWPEIRKWVQKVPKELKEIFPFDVQTDKVTLYENFAVARTAREENPESFQGFHAKNIMLIADEASGVPEAVFLAGQGVMSSKGAITILIGNPTRATGWFYDSHNSDSHLFWTRRISCDQSPMVQPTYMTEMAAKHGIDSYEYKVRVMGEFHLEDSGVIIPRILIDEALVRDVEPDTDYVIWGVDVSAGRDKTAVAKRMGNVLIEPVKAWGGKDVMQSVGIVLDMYYNERYDRKPAEICIDVIGVGHGFVSRLKEELSEEISARRVRVRGINVAERKSVSDRYVSLRVELWAKARAWFETQAVKMPRDDSLAAQLSSVEWEIKDSNGKWFIPDKKSGGAKSPDEADAFILTFAGSRGGPVLQAQKRKNRFAPKTNSMYAIGEASWLQNNGDNR